MVVGRVQEKEISRERTLAKIDKGRTQEQKRKKVTSKLRGGAVRDRDKF